ncbi:MAG: hypothetical protein WC067_02185 [Candidatus Methanomethylophilaceae archaeon]
MDPVERVVDILSSTKGVIGAFVMDDDLSKRILMEERSVISITGMDVQNVGFEEVMGREYRICVVYSNGSFEEPKGTPVIIMVNSSDEIVGTAVSEDMMEEYSERKDVIWISDDFVIFADSNTDGTERFVLPPCRYSALNEKDGCKDAIFSSPATTSDIMMKNHFGVGSSNKTSTIVVGFNVS